MHMIQVRHLSKAEPCLLSRLLNTSGCRLIISRTPCRAKRLQFGSMLTFMVSPLSRPVKIDLTVPTPVDIRLTVSDPSE